MNQKLRSRSLQSLTLISAIAAATIAPSAQAQTDSFTSYRPLGKASELRGALLDTIGKAAAEGAKGTTGSTGGTGDKSGEGKCGDGKCGK